MDNPTRSLVGEKERRIKIRGPLHGDGVDGEGLDRSIHLREHAAGWDIEFRGGIMLLARDLKQAGFDVTVHHLTTNDNCEYMFAKTLAEAKENH